MKLPFVNSSSIDHTITNTRYEPKSVLDIRQSPPSPVTCNSSSLDTYNNNSTNNISSFLPIENFENGMINNNSNNHFEPEWDSDSIMKELGLYDDSNKSSVTYPLTDLPDLPPFYHSEFDYNMNNQNQNDPNNNNNNPFDLMSHQLDDDDVNEYDHEYDFRDELTRLADCFETQSFQLAQVILTRLNNRLRSPNGKPLQRAVFYFKEAIQTLLTGTTRCLTSCTSLEIVQLIKAYKIFSNVSPIPLFSSFTANQAILDVIEGSMNVHVIDFDIGLGGHWASFLKAVAEKAESRKVNSPAVRITAVVPEEYVLESKLIKENLSSFCSELGIRFDIEFVSVRVFEFVSFKSVKFVNGEKTAVVLSPTIFRRIGGGFVNDLRRVSPDVVVYVDGELNGYGNALFRQTVIDGVELFTTVMESLEAANSGGGGGGGGGGEWMRSIEMFVLLPKIIAIVEDSGRRGTAWREMFGRAGMRPVVMSQFAEFQAECLLRRVQVRGFHVAKRHAEMVLCWHDRPLVATSVWTC